MESSFLHSITIIGAIIAAVCGTARLGSYIGRRLEQMSRPVVAPRFVADEQHEPFAVPMTADPSLVHSALGEAFCFGCNKPTSEVGVLASVRMRGANVPADLCVSCDGLYGHHAVERSVLFIVNGDLTDFEIQADAAKVLAFPTSASVVKQGLVS